MARVLIIDDDDAICRTLELHLQSKGLSVSTAGTLREGERLWLQLTPELVILDLKLPDGDGVVLLERQVDAGSTSLVMMITGHSDFEYAIRAMKAGAFNYIHKPINIDELDASVTSALARAAGRAAGIAKSGDEFDAERIAGHSPAILELYKQIGITSRSRVNVLISGETGTGKELVARAIHRNSSADQPFVAVNCSAVVATLMESELFGHERGAFTGAHQRKEGRFEVTGEGTLFLDEIGDLDVALQAKLLRVLQERCFERVGGTTAIPFKGRVIAATHHDLPSLIKSGKFREDLYFRLKVAAIHVPPLREHREDIPELIHHFLLKAGRELHRRVDAVSDATVRKLSAYHWPGNVRELENVLTAAMLRSAGSVLAEVVLDPPAAQQAKAARTLEDIEKEHIRGVLAEADGNLGRACEILGISRPTLRKKMRDYGLS